MGALTVGRRRGERGGRGAEGPGEDKTGEDGGERAEGGRDLHKIQAPGQRDPSERRESAEVVSGLTLRLREHQSALLKEKTEELQSRLQDGDFNSKGPRRYGEELL
jgi:hypothetical protein